MIQLKRVSKSFGNKIVLQDIQFTLERGKVYGVVGENGAGKTTLFRCLAGLESFEGSIQSDFEPIKNHLGFLTTEPYFFPRMTGREYLRFLCQARSKSTENLDERNVFDLPLDEYAQNYSTGMKKKLALTGVLLQENSFYILDEPFNGVDLASNWMITEIIHELKALNKTVLISSHIFSTLKDTCDVIFQLKDGSIGQFVSKDLFSDLEEELKRETVRNGLDRLNLK